MPDTTALRDLIARVEATPHGQLEALIENEPGGADSVFDAIFDLLASEFNPTKARGKKGVFQFEISGSTGVKEYFVHVENHACEAGRGRRESPDITIGIKTPDMVLMGLGKLPGAKAFMTGKLRLSGNPLFGTKLGQWFDHPEI